MEKAPLYAICVEPDRYGPVIDAAKKWVHLNQAKMEEATKLGAIRKPFAISQQVCRWIYDALMGGSCASGTYPFDCVVVSLDARRMIQAIGLYNSIEASICYLATHPNNIDHVVNETIENRVSGAGRAAFLQMALLFTRSTSDKLRVGSLKSATLFWEKMQFTPDGDKCGGEVAMSITRAKMVELVALKTPPFDRLPLEKAATCPYK